MILMTSITYFSNRHHRATPSPTLLEKEAFVHLRLVPDALNLVLMPI